MSEFKRRCTPTTLVQRCATSAAAIPFDIVGRWFSTGDGYYLNHGFTAAGRCQWWLRSPDGTLLAHWSGRYEYRDGHYLFTGDANHPETYSRCRFVWQDANQFISHIVTCSEVRLCGVAHAHQRIT